MSEILNSFRFLIPLGKDCQYYVCSRRTIMACSSLLLSIIVIFIILGLSTIYSDNDNQVMRIKHNRTKLLKYLHRISGYKTLSGIYILNNDTKPNEGVDIIHRVVGVYPAIWCIKMRIYTAGKKEWNSFVEELIDKWNEGYLVRVIWDDEDNPLTNLHEFVNPEYQDKIWKDLIKDGTVLNHLWKAQLDDISPYFQQLQNAGVVAILDILPWASSENYVWKRNPGVNGSLRLHQITHKYMTVDLNLHSLIWTWSFTEHYIKDLEQYWPGEQYVDVASVYLWTQKELTTKEYQKVLKVVREKPLSMEGLDILPTSRLLAAQPRWTWFTVVDSLLENGHENDDNRIKEIFTNPAVINRDNISFFKEPC